MAAVERSTTAEIGTIATATWIGVAVVVDEAPGCVCPVESVEGVSDDEDELATDFVSPAFEFADFEFER